MYRLLRNTHLFVGLFCCVYVLMYGVSAVQMSHRTWLLVESATATSETDLTPGAADGRAVARELMARYSMRGELSQSTLAPDSIAFRIVRPGIVYAVEYAIPSGRTKITESRSNFIGILNRIHHQGGLWHDDWLGNAWGALTGIVAGGLMALSITGVCLWFKIHQERVAGAILLAASLGYSIPLIALIRMAE